MKGLFKSKPRTPPDIVRQTRDLLVYADRSVSTPDLRESKSQEKLAELSKSLRESKLILYGNSEAEPVAEACAQLTLEFFKGETLRGLITSLPYLSLEGRKDATQVNSRLVASDYLESNIDLMDVLVDGFETHRSGVTLYGTMFRECIRHQIVAKSFFYYVQLPNFDIAADAAATFKELLTRQKSTVAEFLTKNEEWFFADFNSKLLESSNYITRRQAIKLFVANQKKPSDIINVLVANRNKLLRLLADLKLDKEDESFEADKAHVVSEIASLKPRDLA
uniref:MO25-like protein n=1 Tax=Brassica campestris TaxID=3711 RepID=M4EBT2_BRACM